MKIIIFTLNTDQLVAVPEPDTLAFLKQYVSNVKAMNECTFIKVNTPVAPAAPEAAPEAEEEPPPAPVETEANPEPRRRRRRTPLNRRTSSEIGAFLKKKRKEAELNQTQISLLLCSSENQDVHIKQEKFSRIERGKSKATVKQFMFICTEIFDLSQDAALELVSKYRTELK